MKKLFRKSKPKQDASELTASFTKPTQREFNEEEFKQWYAGIIYLHHPINNSFYDYQRNK